jgi:glutathione S-transferase
MIELHYFPGNASLAPHIALHELGVSFVLKKVDRERQQHKSPDYLKLNPNGQIPVLVDDGQVLYETAAILLHLADRHPQARLAPQVGSFGRAHFYKWLVWLTNTLQATLMHYFYPDRMVDAGD